MRPRRRTALLPGGVIGILGGGQLGRMLALEARRMGYHTGVLDPTPNGPAAQVADFHIAAPLDDRAAALELARHCAVVTLEWELISLDTLKRISARTPVYPGHQTLSVIQDRLVQRNFLKKNGFPQTQYNGIDGMTAFEEAIKKIGFPCLLKRRRFGYDGKGQLLLRSSADVKNAAGLLEAPCLMEAFVPFKKEISVILARGRDGKTAVFPVAENVHRNGVLHTTRVPALLTAAARNNAQHLAQALARRLEHVGVMAVEMFLTQDDRLLINEIAPRVHNSGHYTWGATATSQFEQHLRAVCGLPLGDTRLLSPVVMLNLLGDLWENGEPRWEAALRHPGARLHLYGKKKPAPGRKMGHILLLDNDTAAALRLADALPDRLKR